MPESVTATVCRGKTSRAISTTRWGGSPALPPAGLASARRGRPAAPLEVPAPPRPVCQAPAATGRQGLPQRLQGGREVGNHLTGRLEGAAPGLVLRPDNDGPPGPPRPRGPFRGV